MIKLINDLYIGADENQFILKQKYPNNPKTTYKILGYYSTVSEAIAGACTRVYRELVQTTDMTLKEALIAFKSIEASIKNLVEI